MNKVCHLDIDPGIGCTAKILGRNPVPVIVVISPKFSFPADLRMTSDFLPGRIIGVLSYLQVHPKGFYFLTMPSYCAAAGVFCVQTSDL